MRQVLATHRGQTLARPDFHLYFFLNAPTDRSGSEKLAHNIDILDRQLGSTENPNFSYCLRLYDWGGSDGTFSMGRVRQEAWWYMLQDSLAKKGSASVGFSHDADTIFLSPNYFRTAASLEADASVITSKVLLGLPPAETQGVHLPALNRLFAYMGVTEEAFRQATRIQAVWDGTAGFFFEAYLAAGGYDVGAEHTETDSLVQAIRGNTDRKLFTRMEKELIVTSGRRYVLRAARGQSPFEGIDPSIGPNETLRDGSLPLREAEQVTRDNFRSWCEQSDINNIRLIETLFRQRDGDSLDLRIDFYNQLVNVGRRLMSQSADSLNRDTDLATRRTSEIVDCLGSAAKEILGNSAT